MLYEYEENCRRVSLIIEFIRVQSHSGGVVPDGMLEDGAPPDDRMHAAEEFEGWKGLLTRADAVYWYGGLDFNSRPDHIGIAWGSAGREHMCVFNPEYSSSEVARLSGLGIVRRQRLGQNPFTKESIHYWTHVDAERILRDRTGEVPASPR